MLQMFCTGALAPLAVRSHVNQTRPCTAADRRIAFVVMPKGHCHRLSVFTTGKPMSWAGLRPAALLLVLLALSIGTAVCEDEKTRGERDELLVAKLKIVEAAQKNLTDTKDVVVESDIVEEAPAATLWAADGDIATTGACGQAGAGRQRRSCRTLQMGVRG